MRGAQRTVWWGNVRALELVLCKRLHQITSHQAAKTSAPGLRPYAGIGHLRCQPGHQPGHRGLPVCSLRRHPGGDPGHRHLAAWHLLHPGRRSRVATREDEASVMGSPHLLGAGRPLRREWTTRHQSPCVLFLWLLCRSKLLLRWFFSKMMRIRLPQKIPPKRAMHQSSFQ